MPAPSAFRPVSKFLLLAGGLAMLAAGFVSAQQYRASPGPGGDKDFIEGLKVWRQPDGNDLACAFCHSPDGIEIASYNFNDANIERRATAHLGPVGAKKIVQFIHAVRRRYGITKLLDPMKDRPLQPGGSVLPGATPAERDLAFGNELEQALPTLATGDVDSLASAEKAKDELVALNPRNLRVGILFNRLSEDGFHGMEHATFANWIADTALRFHFPWEVYFVLQDRYMREPTDQNFLLMAEFPKLHQAKEYAQLAQLMTNDKYRALLTYTHILRARAMGEQSFDERGPVLLGKLGRKELPNPLLDLGLFADERSETPFGQFNFPSATLEKKEQGVKESDQMKHLRLPSLYAGWLMDQGLMRSEDCPEQQAADTLSERLLTDGPFPIHDIFAITKKLVTDGFSPEAWEGDGPQHFQIDYASLLDENNLEMYEPNDPEARRLFRRLVANSFKMSIYLANKQGSLTEGNSTQQITKMVAYLRRVDPKGAAAVEPLVAERN